MSATIFKEHGVDNQEVSVDPNGFKATRRLLLTGVTASAVEGIVYAGITDSGLPALGVGIGLAHPIMTALYCYSITAKAVDKDKVELIATYSPFQSNVLPNNSQVPLLTVSSFIQSQETNEDATGATMIITHGSDPDQVATSSFDTCLTNLVFSRLETGPPLALQSYVDTLNSASITYRGVTYSAKTLKCTSINGTPRTDTGAYQIEYTLLFNPNGWQFTGVYTLDGIVPGDVSLGNGIETFDMYPTSSFSGMLLA